MNPSDSLSSRLYQRSARRLAYRPEVLGEFDQWAGAVRARLRDLLKVDPLPAHPPAGEVTACGESEGLRREHVWIADETFGPVPAFVMWRSDLAAPAPGVLCLHGHGGYYAGKDMVAGNLDTHPTARECAEALNYAYGVQLARAGFVTISPDAYGFGERMEAADRWTTAHACDRYLAGLAAFGYSSAGVTTRGNLLALDYLLSRPEVRPGSAGCVGLSYGGFQALLLAAVEPRIAATVISGALYGHGEGGDGVCGAQVVPGILEWFDLPDLAASLAPRPLLYEMMKRDGCFDFAVSWRLYQRIQAVYTGLGHGDRIDHDVADTDHRYIGRKVPEFFGRHL